MKDKIKLLAKEFGFDTFGVTSIDALGEGEKAINQWVSEGKHGTMAYLENFQERKQKFYADFPDAKSVMVLGVNYYTSHESSVLGLEKDHSSRLIPHDSRLTGRIARYAWGKDYHLIIAKRHEQLIQKLREIYPSLKAKSCVDIQPIPERFAAQQAGLGFLGKHTGLLSKDFGPWLFLSEIVTNLDLEEDLPSQGDCGTCVECQTICPTGALNEDYEMDARLCIAYWTIEHKGVIPREMWSKIKDWIFGCDECFAVCPFTSKLFHPHPTPLPKGEGRVRETRWQELSPSAGKGEWLDIAALFEIRSNREYENEFEGTALLRAGRKQMLRNACLVLANSQKEEAIPLLIKGLQDSAPLVRLHAAWGLGQFSHSDARHALETRFQAETDLEVKEEITLALKR